MPFMNWEDRYSVDLAMDVEHKTWVAILNRLHDAMMGGQGKAAQESIMREILAYTRTHFAHEEALLQARGYPELAQHQQLHQGFTRKVQALEAKLRAGEPVLSVDLLGFLKEWLKNHILAADTKYGAWLKSH